MLQITQVRVRKNIGRFALSPRPNEGFCFMRVLTMLNKYPSTLFFYSACQDADMAIYNFILPDTIMPSSAFDPLRLHKILWLTGPILNQ